MSAALVQRILDRVSETANLYHRLILVTGPPRTGKTTALRLLETEQSWPRVNINLILSERLLELTTRQRALRVAGILQRIIKQDGSTARGAGAAEVVILDNTEVLFSLELQQDPLRLLQGLSRNQTVIASWAGTFEDGVLAYADPTHPERRRYNRPDAVIVPTEWIAARQPENATQEDSA